MPRLRTTHTLRCDHFSDASFRTLFVAVSAVTWLGCGEPQGEPGPSTPCDADTQRCQLSHRFSEIDLEAGQERSGLCVSWTLGNPTDLWVNSVEMANLGGYHHSNWLFVPDALYPTPDGIWDCKKAGFDEAAAAALGGVLFAQSTQSTQEHQQFPKGAAVRLPAYTRVIGSLHLLNASPTALRTQLSLSLSTLPTVEVSHPLAPFRLSYYALALPPAQVSEFGTSCDLRAPYEKLKKKPFSFRLYYALPHYHELGTEFRLGVHGGPDAGRELYRSSRSLGEPAGQLFDPPIDVSAAAGLSFACRFDNPRAQEVRWGIGDQEMCVMLGFSDAAVAFDAAVVRGQNQRLPDDRGIAMNTGPCTVPLVSFQSVR